MNGVNLWTRHEIELERIRQAIPGGPERWMPERLIFRDWWHWRDHEIGFAHGRLALTGQNGSGKSTLLSLCLPTLLDGETSGNRLDPAMSRDRHLHWYLLGDDDADPEQPEAFAYMARTGYFAMELRHGGTGRYLTIGMGVAAARNHPRLVREWWGFVVPDRRLGRDWDVRAEDNGNCLGLRDLQQLLEPPCVVTEERAEYRRQVNAHLFEMQDDDYQALISMLLQARRPKLGEQAGPDHVCRLLRDSLPGVAAERLDRVAEVVENIERCQRNLQGVTRRAEAVAEVDARLRALAEVLAQDAARLYQEAAGNLGSVAAKLQRARVGLSAAEEALGGLRVRADARATRQTEITAALKVYRERPEADLTGQVADTQEALRAADAHALQLARLLDQKQDDLQEHDLALRAEEGRFQRRRDATVEEWRQMAAVAGGAGWGAGERALQAAAEALDRLGVGTEEAALSLTWPDAGLAAEGEALHRAYRDAAERRRARDAAEAEARRQRDRMVELRTAHAEAVDAESEAAEGVAGRRETLLQALEAWRGANGALVLEPEALAPVTMAVAALEGVPGDGVEGLLGPVRQAAEARRGRLNETRRQALQEVGRTAVLVESLEGEITAVEARGMLPDRGALRREARSGADGPRPVFHWVRFRDGVDEATAAAVEAAGLEAGLLDLLLDPGAGDAWALPAAAPAAGASLLEVLEPEPGAPDAVIALLAAIGWGEGPSDLWIAPDGRWRHGQAAGQVAPWLHEAVGVVGEARRAAVGRARLEALVRARHAAEERRDAALTRAAEAERAATALDGEVEAARALPWQPLFSALQARDASANVVEEAARRVEEGRPAHDAALAAHQAAHREYEAVVALLPDARRLDAEGLGARAAELGRVTQRLGEMEANDLLDAVGAYRNRSKQRDRDSEQAEAMRPDVDEAERAVAAARSRAQALQERLRDPDVARLRDEIERLDGERRQLEADAQEENARASAESNKISEASGRISEIEPQEGHFRALAAEHLDRLKHRLTLHESLAQHTDVMEREGPGAVLPRLPRPVQPTDPAALDEAVQQAKADLQNYVQRHMDVLGEERPTASAAWETVTFRREREALAAAELGRRLAAEVERDQRLIAQEEQELYERIIYHGVLDELRQRISRARSFTSRTNRRLRELKFSGGERLSLRLSTCDPATVPGAEVGRVLEELDQGGEWLSQERREVLLRQIRAEVERVREEAAAEGEALGYYEAIRRGLDYRRWYEFRLMSQPEGAAQPVEVRSRGFGRWSTSAKALAMAVPILAGVAARYEAAGRADAPALVGLDEVFAGFDPNNQANYLRFLGDLGLSWIITCPEELPYGPGLSAAMAYGLTLRGNVHVAFPLLWDGARAREPLAEGHGDGEAAAARAAES